MLRKINMTNEQILKESILKAHENGLDLKSSGAATLALALDEKPEVVWRTRIYLAFIFSHEFAKAFWGDEKIVHDCGLPAQDETKGEDMHVHKGHCYYVRWAFHLRQMIVEEEPLKYLSRFLKERR